MRILLALAGLCLAVAGCSVPRHDPPFRQVSMEAEIDINRPIEAVFAFATDPLNERLWRDEVRHLSASGPMGLGIVLDEVIQIGFSSNSEIRVEVTAFDAPSLFRVQAVATHNRNFRSERTFTKLNDNWTRVNYSTITDERLVFEIALVPIGLATTAAYYEWVMQENLRRLKHLLEASTGEVGKDF
ncbi:MAG: hypothetical protein GY945_11395 [Rhodobacteraceae bacterium]|nr:hypothetical protein [Paracoccaceae bacterium]